jgi:hypothetical protein
MRIFILIVILLAVIGLLIIVSFKKDLGAQILDSLLGMNIPATSTPNLAPRVPSGQSQPPKTLGNSSSSQVPKSVPPGYQGPSGPPRVVGPSGNPPNY